MPDDPNVANTALRTPKAAAVAGIAFSVLTAAIFWLLRTNFPVEPETALARLGRNATIITLATGLVPFAGIAFLWFIGVLRDRFGHREDRFFATVFLGSGLLFLALFFTAAGIVSSMVAAFAVKPHQSINQDAFVFVRNLAFILMNVFAIKMAAVFMISTSMVIARTRAAPRYLAYLGVAFALLILLGSQSLDWSFFVFPVWVLLFSIQILADNFRRPAAAQPDTRNPRADAR
jgi:MFS family permease